MSEATPMIPKIIHYCWFGGSPLPEMAIKCIESWKKFLPDYEIKQWDETNFDVNMIPYAAEAYKAKKYAFVSDFARFWILYNYGGLYFDTDVQLIKGIDDIVKRGPFMGCERDADEKAGEAADQPSVAPGFGLAANPGLGLAANPGLGLYSELLTLYKGLHFINPNGSYNQKTIVAYTTEVLCKHGLKNVPGIQECAGVWIYPMEYFCPLDYVTKELNITDNTRSIHLYSASWITGSQLMYKKVERIVGKKIAQFLSRTLKQIRIFK